ncbi:MAG: hypothetical protein WCP11_02440 [Candidatus Saccharibacteria bacterium]
MNDLEIYSNQAKKTAQKILDQTNLIQILSKYGEVIIGGSFKYDLMWGPDIDICVICDDTRHASTSALHELIDNKVAQKYEYGDFVAFPRDKRPKSYILNLILPSDGQKWEIETWFFNEYPDNQTVTNKLIADKLTDETRQMILEMKKQRAESGDDKHQISSVDIYRQVLENGVKDYNQLI